MSAPQKRVALLCDVSCAGRCSASVALPVLAAAGLQCALLPTMLLSAHTGFPGAVKAPQTAFMRQTAAHWRALGLRFDAILTGYLGGGEALDAALGFVDAFKQNDTLLVVDPAMADGGRLYSGYAPDYPARFAALAARADVLLPNAAEAALLLGETPAAQPDKAAAASLLAGLRARGARNVLLTGLHFSAGTVAVAADGEAGAFCCENAYAPSHLFGTGDLYAAALTAALVRGHSLRRAAAIAGDFTALCARRTAAEPGRDPRFGVRFEDSLGELIAQLGAAQN